jgi:hypothetical protein
MARKARPGLFDAPADLLDYEIVQEQASALGRLGRALEAALAALRDFDATIPAPSAPADRRTRNALVADAAYALWLFVVQRESCGLRDSRTVMRDYQVPSEVRNKMGMKTSNQGSIIRDQ